MHFAKHYFITITIVVLAILVIPTTADLFSDYIDEFKSMLLFIDL
jgi:hypothetical protein